MQLAYRKCFLPFGYWKPQVRTLGFDFILVWVVEVMSPIEKWQQRIVTVTRLVFLHPYFYIHLGNEGKDLSAMRVGVWFCKNKSILFFMFSSKWAFFTIMIEMWQGTLLDCLSLHLCLNKEYIQGKDANLISINQKACEILLEPIELQYCILLRTFSWWFSVAI